MIHDRDLLIKGLIIGSALIGYKVALLNLLLVSRGHESLIFLLSNF